MKKTVKCTVLLAYYLFLVYCLVGCKKTSRKIPKRVTIDVSGSVVEHKEALPSQIIKDITYPTISEHIFAGSSTKRQEKVDIGQIQRCIATIASAQSAWKSMDGATHQFKSTFKSRYLVTELLQVKSYLFVPS